MLNIPLRRVEGNKVILDSKVFEQLVQRAQTVEDVVIEETADDLPARRIGRHWSWRFLVMEKM